MARTNGALDDGRPTQCDSWRCTAEIGRPIRIMTGIAPDPPIASNRLGLKWRAYALIKRVYVRGPRLIAAVPFQSLFVPQALEFDRGTCGNFGDFAIMG